MLRSKTYADNLTIDGVLLGQPTIVNGSGVPYQPGDDIADLWFAWDDARIPSGVLEPDGSITPDTTTA